MHIHMYEYVKYNVYVWMYMLLDFFIEYIEDSEYTCLAKIREPLKALQYLVTYFFVMRY